MKDRTAGALREGRFLYFNSVLLKKTNEID